MTGEAASRRSRAPPGDGARAKPEQFGRSRAPPGDGARAKPEQVSKDGRPSCVLLVGIPASGKSSFFKARFADTHVRLNQDMLRTPHRLRVLRDACLGAGASFVLDNTHVTRAVRREHIEAARAAGFRVEGYFFQSRQAECLARNEGRTGPARIPDAAVRGMSARLELPAPDEGYDALHLVRLVPGGGFDVQEWTAVKADDLVPPAPCPPP